MFYKSKILDNLELFKQLKMKCLFAGNISSQY